MFPCIRQAAFAILGIAVALNFIAALHRGRLEASMRLPVAPATLGDTGLYDSTGVVDVRNRPFSPQYPLWTDGAVKRRWIQLPDGATIDASDVHEWQLPVGTKLWKEFAFGGRKVETRFLWKRGDEDWVFASYLWNAEGMQATLAPPEGVARAAEIAPKRFHGVPAVEQCRACHVSRRTEVLGFNALQLSDDRDPNAVHGEPLEPGMVTIRTLVDENRFAPPRPELVEAPPRINARSADERSLLGYLAGNCGACHNRQSDLAPLGFSWKHGEVATAGAASLLALVSHPTKWQVPGLPEGESYALDPNRPEQSAILRRMKSRSAASQMPPLGTALVDAEAVALLSRWLATPDAWSRGYER